MIVTCAKISWSLSALSPGGEVPQVSGNKPDPCPLDNGVGVMGRVASGQLDALCQTHDLESAGMIQLCWGHLVIDFTIRKKISDFT